MDDAYDELVALEEATLGQGRIERVRRLSGAYDRSFAPLIHSADLGSASPAKLEVLLLAGQHLAFYSDDPRYLDDMTLVMRAYGSQAGKDAFKRYHASLMQFRRFADARRLAQESPGVDFEPVPDVGAAQPGITPNAYEVDADRRQLQEIEVPVQGDLLVAVAHPRCGFSLNAMHDLLRSSLLRGIRVAWLAPVAQRIDFEAIAEWNAGHPDQKIVLARNTGDWRMIDEWAIPNFYLL